MSTTILINYGDFGKNMIHFLMAEMKRSRKEQVGKPRVFLHIYTHHDSNSPLTAQDRKLLNQLPCILFFNLDCQVLLSQSESLEYIDTKKRLIKERTLCNDYEIML